MLDVLQNFGFFCKVQKFGKEVISVEGCLYFMLVWEEGNVYCIEL